MGRPRLPIENLSRQHKGRGYEINLQTLEIQNEIIRQYSKIKNMLSNINDIKNKEEISKYETLVNLLLKINNQVKTFSIKNLSLEEFEESMGK